MKSLTEFILERAPYGYEGMELFLGNALNGIKRRKEWDESSAELFCALSQGQAQVLDVDQNRVKSSVIDLTHPVVIFPEWRTQKKYIIKLENEFQEELNKLSLAIDIFHNYIIVGKSIYDRNIEDDDSSSGNITTIFGEKPIDINILKEFKEEANQWIKNYAKKFTDLTPDFWNDVRNSKEYNSILKKYGLKEGPKVDKKSKHLTYDLLYKGQNVARVCYGDLFGNGDEFSVVRGFRSV